MTAKKTFAIIGGDFRQIYLAKKFQGSGNKVFLYGFDKLKNSSHYISLSSINDTIIQSDYIILPLPPTRDGIHLNTPLSKNTVKISEEILNLLHSKIIFGNLTKFTKHTDGYTIYDYSKSEDFQIMNAVPTAEGAIKVALDAKSQTLFKSSCLICGLGRIGKILANRLANFRPNITVTARNDTDLTWASALGYKCIPLKQIADNLQEFDLIFNTIPKVIFNESLLINCNKDVLIIDLASAPGGIDKVAAEKLNVNYRHELGIPGRMFPETAANIVYRSIKKIIEEEIL